MWRSWLFRICWSVKFFYDTVISLFDRFETFRSIIQVTAVIRTLGNCSNKPSVGTSRLAHAPDFHVNARATAILNAPTPFLLELKLQEGIEFFHSSFADYFLTMWSVETILLCNTFELFQCPWCLSSHSCWIILPINSWRKHSHQIHNDWSHLKFWMFCLHIWLKTK